MAKAKTSCPITRNQFREHAEAIEVTINGIPMAAEVKEFSTGSLGWYLNGKSMLPVGDKKVSVQIGLNLTIVGSKGLPQSEPEPAAPAAEENVDPETGEPLD